MPSSWQRKLLTLRRLRSPASRIRCGTRGTAGLPRCTCGTWWMSCGSGPSGCSPWPTILAEARRYQLLSPAVGLMVLRSAAQEWTATAAMAPADAEVCHPQFGVLGAVEIIRRNAHEVHHHLMDINRAAG